MIKLQLQITSAISTCHDKSYALSHHKLRLASTDQQAILHRT